MWTNNCVGIFNRKYFTLIIFWGAFEFFIATLFIPKYFFLIFSRIKVEFKIFVNINFSR